MKGIRNMCTVVELLYCVYHSDFSKTFQRLFKETFQRDVLISNVALYTKATFGIPASVLFNEVSLFMIREVPQYCIYLLPQVSNI